jgi:hypothetical protein
MEFLRPLTAQPRQEQAVVVVGAIVQHRPWAALAAAALAAQTTQTMQRLEL